MDEHYISTQARKLATRLVCELDQLQLTEEEKRFAMSEAASQLTTHLSLSLKVAMLIEAEPVGPKTRGCSINGPFAVPNLPRGH